MHMRVGQKIKVLSPGLTPLYRNCTFIKYKSNKEAIVDPLDTEGYIVVSLSRILVC